jgi:trehalose/maltose transport system substrate-binding protein
VDNTPAPTVPNAAAAKQFSGANITFNGDSVGGSTAIDNALAAQFTKDTGINVKVIPHPSSSDDYYASLQRIFQGQSGEIDVMMLDVIWPGAFAQYLTDLNPKLGTDAKAQFDTAVQNDTVNNQLVAMPYFGDFGMLFYRTDLLQKYGYSNPPETWDDLQTMAQKIIDGEKGSNSNFTGLVFQGKAYEGLTCDALEWLASSGGGTIIDSSGKVTVSNDSAVKALNRAKGWIGTISPPAVTSYQEDESLNAFQAGNSAFMRNWPYAYAIANDPKQSKVAGKVDVAPLPHDTGQESVGTLGGWQLGVNKFSKNQDAAIEFVRYMTSQQVQTYRGIVGGYVPLNTAAAQDPKVIQAEPYLAKMANVTRVARPSTATGINYNDVSTSFFQGVSQILAGQDAASVLPNVQSRIQNDVK